VVADPGLALELRRVHALLSRAAEPLEAESRLAALLGELVRRHSSPASPPDEVRRAGTMARQVMSRLADQLACPPGLTGFADQAHLTRWFRRVAGITPGAYRNSVQDSTPRPG
jgi:hypothetical protein